MATQATTLSAIDLMRSEVAGIGGTVPPPSGFIVKLGLIFAMVGMMPFAVGHPFKRGDVPQGSTVIADCAKFQCTPWAYFDDGSVRFARLAGEVQVSVPGRVDVAMRLGPAATASPPFVRVAMPDIKVWINGALIPPKVKRVVASGSAALHEQWECGFDQQVAVTYETISLISGTCVTIPRGENMGFMAAGQSERKIAFKVAIGGTVVFVEEVGPDTDVLTGQVVDHRVTLAHHSIATLLGKSQWIQSRRDSAGQFVPGKLQWTGSSQWTQWIGGDPTVFAEYDHAYVCACESWAPYSPAANAVLGNFAQSYFPNYIGEDGPDMPGPGYGPHIGLCSRSSIFPLTLGGRKAMNYAITEALSACSWSRNFRDETTGDIPLMRSYPNHSRQSNIPNGSGPQNGNHDIAHHPSLSYVAAALTGWQCLIDDVLRLAVSNHFQQWPILRGYANGWGRTDIGMNAVRGGGWMLRTLAQALAICPANHPLFADLVNAWEQNMAWYRGRYVDGTIDGGKWVNNLGALGTYTSDGRSPYNNPVDIGSSAGYWDAAWMHAMVTQTLGMALYMHLPVGAQGQSDTTACFMQSAKMIVGLCGDMTNNTANYRRFGYYAYPLGPVGSSIPPNSGWFPDHRSSYDHYIASIGLQALDPALGGTLKQHNLEKNVIAQDWTTGFLSYEFPALVFAKMHGAPGADAAWTRVTSSASWSLIAAGINEPEWAGMMPLGMKHPGSI